MMPTTLGSYYICMFAYKSASWYSLCSMKLDSSVGGNPLILVTQCACAPSRKKKFKIEVQYVEYSTWHELEPWQCIFVTTNIIHQNCPMKNTHIYLTFCTWSSKISSITKKISQGQVSVMRTTFLTWQSTGKNTCSVKEDIKKATGIICLDQEYNNHFFSSKIFNMIHQLDPE